MKKRTIAVFLSILMALTMLVSCGKTENTDTSGVASAESDASAVDESVVFVSSIRDSEGTIISSTKYTMNGGQKIMIEEMTTLDDGTKKTVYFENGVPKKEVITDVNGNVVSETSVSPSESK